MFPEIQNYTIKRKIGTGEIAVVYGATDERLHRTVAIKILHPHLSKEVTASDRFLREARAAAKIDHSNVVRIYDFGLAQRLPDPRLTSENDVAGTPSFMIPEQLSSNTLSRGG